MPHSSVRRARYRLRTIVALLAGLVFWAAPRPALETALATDVALDKGTISGCGRNWGPAVQLEDLPGNLLEVSGFVSSAKHPGVAWMIQDSDNPENLYSFELDGHLPRWKKFPVAGAAGNVDWEDIAYSVGPDGRGRVWILENGIETGPKTIYEVLEPDPHTDHIAHVVATYRFEYPGGNVNTEAMFMVGGRLAVVSKTNPNRLYKLPSPLSRPRTNYASDAGRLDVSSWVTAAAVSGDEKLLAIVTTADDLTVFETKADSAGEISAFAGPDPVFRRSMPETQREAADFFPSAACDIVTVSEDGTVWRLPNAHSTTPRGVPGPPTEVSGTAAEGSVTVSWTAPLDGGGTGVTGYRITAHRDAVEVASVTSPDGAATAAVVTGLGNGVPYTFTVTAFNVSGAGPASVPSGPVTPGDLSPRHPAAAPDRPAARPPAASGPTGSGYWLLGSDGIVHPFGGAAHLGGAAGSLGSTPAVDLEVTPSSGGYWVLDRAGRVHAHGDAHHLGDVDPARLSTGEAVTSMSRTPTGAGYWVFTSGGRVLPFGDAASFGDLTHLALNGPVVDSVASPTGFGYYMVASDGGVFAFGDARFVGSMGNVRLNAPVRSLVPDRDGAGYWLVASDGGVFAFDAPFRGSMGATPLNRPVAGMVAFGGGYLMVGEDGGVFNFSDRPFHGSLGDHPPVHAIVSVAAASS